jgi:hypothetical protein
MAGLEKGRDFRIGKVLRVVVKYVYSLCMLLVGALNIRRI